MRMLAVATEKRIPQFPDVPTFTELGVKWVDGAYRGVAVPKSTPENVRKQVSDMMDALNKDPELRKRMVDGGFEVTDIGYEQMPAFMKERVQDYMGTAKLMGLGEVNATKIPAASRAAADVEVVVLSKQLDRIEVVSARASNVRCDDAHAERRPTRQCMGREIVYERSREAVKLTSRGCRIRDFKR